ncbi:MAG: OmpA family protein [Stenotrophobium sp.]
MKYRSGLLAAFLSLAVALPVFAQNDAGAAAPAADTSAPAPDTSAAPAAADSSTAPAADSSAAAPAADASAPAADASAAPAPAEAAAPAASDASAPAAADASAPAADASAAPAATEAAAPAASDTSAPAADSGSAPAADANAAPAATDTSSAPADTSASSSSDNGGGGGGSDSGGGSHASSPIPGREFYVSPMFSYVLADKARGTKHGIGGIMTVGKKMTDGLNLEITGMYESFKDDKAANNAGYNGTFKLSGVGLGAMLFPLSSLPDLYGLVNVSYGAGKRLPGTIPNYHTTIFDTGIGYLYPITRNILLRAEARFRMDAHFREQSGIHTGDKSAFYDGVFNIGLLIPLGTPAAPAEAPPPPAAEVVAAPPPAAAPTCPNKPADMPEGAPVDANGCPLDSDGDGVPDYKDECPHTPAGAKVLPNGCALTGDCRTPKAGEAVDANGCAANGTFILKGVNFDFDSDRLTEDSKEILNQVAETLKSYPDIKVEVAGHTDDVGSEAYNLGLSERRAKSVKDYLASHDVNADRMTPVGYGKTQPLVQGTTEEDRAKNRRVELKVKE